ncbi:hypothetical protein GWK47_054656 [Chionoecetes opilio]|uniref:Uncharacterized protein n=1 Tax=Chionoecetes opilio TaxID=41210 RepID=A0A8J5CRM7_CHIOP|nr:hypothetical protein GWK47_054656 [Chionoecetes opilio]
MVAAYSACSDRKAVTVSLASAEWASTVSTVAARQLYTLCVHLPGCEGQRRENVPILETAGPQSCVGVLAGHWTRHLHCLHHWKHRSRAPRGGLSGGVVTQPVVSLTALALWNTHKRRDIPAVVPVSPRGLTRLEQAVGLGGLGVLQLHQSQGSTLDLSSHPSVRGLHTHPEWPAYSK